MSDIVSVELLDELPRLIKNNGTSTNKILLGNFSLQDYGKGELFINKQAQSYILIELISGEYVLLNAIDDATTLEYYSNLKINQAVVSKFLRVKQMINR